MSDGVGASPDIPLCFLLGIMQRSGTNHLSRLLVLHPQVIGPGPIWEDFLLYESDRLREYVKGVRSRWNAKWDVGKTVGSQDQMLQHLGDGLQRFLNLQVRPADALAPASLPANERKVTPIIRLTKTPSVKGLDNFPTLFPQAKLILLVRDGRAVVESAVRSFGWNYDDATRLWAEGAKAIIEFTRGGTVPPDRMLLVKYEDLVTDEKNQLLRIFSYLGLDASLYSFEKARSLDVRGSSDLKMAGNDLHWRGAEKNGSFNPLERFGDWDDAQHARFNRIAGRYLSALGYSITAAAGGD